MKQFLFTLTVLAMAIFVIVISSEGSIYSEGQQKKTQAEILDAVPFDKVVLQTLIALEQNYQVKNRLLPLVHKDDYYAVILNTTKRIALNAPGIQPKVSPVIPAKKDSSNVKK